MPILEITAPDGKVYASRVGVLDEGAKNACSSNDGSKRKSR